MATEIEMPALSGSMTEGTLLRWLKSEGEAINVGDLLCEIETDKAVLEVEAPAAGILGRILVPGGTDAVPVGNAIAVILEQGEKLAATNTLHLQQSDTTPPAALAEQRAAVATGPTPMASVGDRIFASPLARRIAANNGIDLSTVQGSGPGGRIVRNDVADLIKPTRTAPTIPPSSPEPSLSKEQRTAAQAKVTEIPNSSMRKVIARRLSESKQEVPHFYLSVDIDVDALVKLREQLNERIADSKLSINDLIIKAAAQALARVPECNASWTEAAILRNKDVDVSVAVATDGGLITPVVRNADKKGLETISVEIKELASRARANKLKPDEYQGGSITISNLGMYGIRNFAAIINPPQAAILAVGAAELRPVVRDGAVTVVRQISCTLSVDHRVIDGALGARYLAELKEIIQDPLRIML